MNKQVVDDGLAHIGSESISEFLFLQIHTKNADGGVGRLVETIAKFMRSEHVKMKIRQELEKKAKT